MLARRSLCILGFPGPIPPLLSRLVSTKLLNGPANGRARVSGFQRIGTKLLAFSSTELSVRAAGWSPRAGTSARQCAGRETSCYIEGRQGEAFRERLARHNAYVVRKEVAGSSRLLDHAINFVHDLTTDSARCDMSSRPLSFSFLSLIAWEVPSARKPLCFLEITQSHILAVYSIA